MEDETIGPMPTFSAPDGTLLAYRTIGDGDPVVCIPGGPMQDASYLGDLAGLSRHRRLVLLDPRGTGGSAVPEDPTSYRCDRLVGDVEALREHLGLDRVDLLAHCAGANLATLYAARHSVRLGKLVLVMPSMYAVGITPSDQARREIAESRKDEPWFDRAFAALQAIQAGGFTDENAKAIDPFFYGRWDAAARAHVAAQQGRQNEEAAAVYGSEGAYDPDATRVALAGVDSPVLVLAGEVDLNSPPVTVAEFATLFPRAEYVVQAGAGHFGWLDDADRFVAAVAGFLA
jgi:proline iminopeptidase